MELKMKYSYSTFIYPYLIKENSYRSYIQRLMKNSKCTPKLFNMEKDIGIYNFFLPSIRKYMFKSFEFSNTTSTTDKSLDSKLKENLFKSSPCTIFDYNIGKDIQAKTGEEDGIFFKIEKIEIICFETGICFLAIKTNIEETDKFSDFLNFNYRFRDMNSEYDNFSNIKLQTNTFGDIKKLSEVIKEITGNTEDSKNIDIDINKFITYSYVCLDREYWNDTKTFDEIEKEFFKFANVLNSEFNSCFNNDRLKTVSLGKYTRVRN